MRKRHAYNGIRQLIRSHECGTAGIVVLRLPNRQSHQLLLDLIGTLAEALKTEAIHGKLWIVEPGRIRIHDTE